jgi:hypothetical protein
VFNNDRKIGLIEENAHGLQYGPGRTRVPGRQVHPFKLSRRADNSDLRLNRWPPPLGVSLAGLVALWRDPYGARSTFGDGNAFRHSEVVQSDKGIWIRSAFWRRRQGRVRPHFGRGAGRPELA